MKLSRVAPVFLVLVFLLTLVLPAGFAPLKNVDEIRYAEIPREMLASGDWISPRLNGLRYFEKPVLGYWLNAVSLAVVGSHPLAARLPAVLATGLTALLIRRLVRRFADDARAADLAAGIYLSSLMILIVGGLNVLDAPLTCFLTGTLVFFLEGAESPPGARRVRNFLACGAWCGAALLTKGFLAPVVVALEAGPYLIWQRRSRDLLRIPWLPLLAALAVCLPWAVAIHLREPDFWRYFIWEEHVRRFFSERAQHPEAPWFFLPLFAGGLLPWLAVVPSAVGGLRASGASPLARFAWCWLLLPFLFFSASRGKLPAYILPCFPPASILLALGLCRQAVDGRFRAFDRGARCLCVFFLCAAVVLAVRHGGRRDYREDEGLRRGLGVAALAAFAVSSWASARARRPVWKWGWLTVSPSAVAVLAPFALPAGFEAERTPMPFLHSLDARIPANLLLVSDNNRAHAMAWWRQRADVFMVGWEGEFAYGLGHPEAAGRHLAVGEVGDWLKARSAHEPVLVLTNRERLASWPDTLPQPLWVQADPRVPGGRAWVVALFGPHPPSPSAFPAEGSVPDPNVR